MEGGCFLCIAASIAPSRTRSGVEHALRRPATVARGLWPALMPVTERQPDACWEACLGVCAFAETRVLRAWRRLRRPRQEEDQDRRWRAQRGSTATAARRPSPAQFAGTRSGWICHRSDPVGSSGAREASTRRQLLARSSPSNAGRRCAASQMESHRIHLPPSTAAGAEPIPRPGWHPDGRWS